MYEYINYIMIHSYKLHTYNPSRERTQGDLGSPLRIQPTLGNLWYKTDKLKDDTVLAQPFFSEKIDRHVCPLLCPEKKSANETSKDVQSL